MTDESMEALSPAQRNPSMCGGRRHFIIEAEPERVYCTDDERCECEICVSLKEGEENVA